MSPSPPAGAGDGLHQLAALRDRVVALFDQLAQRPADSAASAELGPLSQLLLALEMRATLEEQLLLPALYEAGVHDDPRIASIERDWRTLRAHVDQLRAAAHRASDHHHTLLTLEHEALLHFGRIEGLLTQHAARIDQTRFSRDVHSLLSRWRDELQRSGDIEDESRDPVGQVPR